MPLIDVRSALTHLEGSASGETYDADRLIGLDPADGRPLLARYDLERAAATLTRASLAARRAGGLWRWAELLPVRDPGRRIHLGEGATPLLDAPRLGRELGVPGLRVKAEGLNPTGSFKARGMAAAVSRAAELGATALVAPSAGNAGGALAAYGAAAGLPVTVVMPRDVPAVNRDEAAVMGARVILHDGLIDECGAVAREIAAETGAFDVSTLKEPYRVEGKKTMGLELAEDLGWRLPDVIVYPTGGGTGLIGMWKAFAEMETLGWISGARPRMVSVQADGCAPIVRAFERGEETAAPWEDPRTEASGLRVPSAIGDFLILRAIRESGGTAVAVSDAEMRAGIRALGRTEGCVTAPEGGATLAAAQRLAASGWIRPTDRVVLFLTGTGLKYLESLAG
jgi:threonine synthase